MPGLQLEWIDGICAPLYEVTPSLVLRPTRSIQLTEEKGAGKKEKSQGYVFVLLKVNARAALRQRSGVDESVRTGSRDVGLKASSFRGL